MSDLKIVKFCGRWEVEAKVKNGDMFSLAFRKTCIVWKLEDLEWFPLNSFVCSLRLKFLMKTWASGGLKISTPPDLSVPLTLNEDLTSLVRRHTRSSVTFDRNPSHLWVTGVNYLWWYLCFNLLIPESTVGFSIGRGWSLFLFAQERSI